MTKQSDKQIRLLEKKFYTLRNNLLGCISKGIINSVEAGNMILEVRRAQKDWDSALLSTSKQIQKHMWEPTKN